MCVVCVCVCNERFGIKAKRIYRNKIVLPECVNFTTNVWLHHFDLDEMHGKKNQVGNETRILHAVVNKFWKQYPTKQYLYDQ